MKDGTYYVIHSWMINQLSLKGNDLLVYALIYDFSKDGESEFDRTLSYITEATGSSRNSVIRSLKYLVDRKLLIKKECFVNNMKIVRYVAITPFDYGIKSQDTNNPDYPEI